MINKRERVSVGFIKDVKRFNVAVTRCKYMHFIVCDATALYISERRQNTIDDRGNMWAGSIAFVCIPLAMAGTKEEPYESHSQDWRVLSEIRQADYADPYYYQL